MTEAAAIVSAVDGDPSLREALQSLIRSMGWHVTPLGRTPDVLTGNCPNALCGSVAICHAPSISGILRPAVHYRGSEGINSRGEGRTGPDASSTVRRPSPRIRGSRHLLRLLTTLAADPAMIPS